MAQNAGATNKIIQPDQQGAGAFGNLGGCIQLTVATLILPLKTPSPGEVFIFYRHIAHVTQKVTKVSCFLRGKLWVVSFCVPWRPTRKGHPRKTRTAIRLPRPSAAIGTFLFKKGKQPAGFLPVEKAPWRKYIHVSSSRIDSLQNQPAQS